MKVLYKDMFFNFSQLAIVNDIIKINNKEYAAEVGWTLQREAPLEERETFDLSFVIKKLNQLKKNKKLHDVILVLDYNTPTMEIEINHDSNGKISNIKISTSPVFLSLLDEDDVFIFICHEFGHLLDINSLLKKERFIKTFDTITKTCGIIGGVSIYWLFREQLPHFWLLGSVFLFFTSFFSTLLFIKKLLAAYLSRMSEYQADVFAVKLHGDLNAVINSFKALQDLEEIPEHSNWFSSHPSVLARINHLKRTFWLRRLIDKLFN